MHHLVLLNLPTLIALYSSPGRHYHNLNHIHFCLARMEEAKLREEFKFTNAEWGALEMAIWFHDAIYNAEAQMVKKGGYSEEESVDLMYGLAIDYFAQPYRPGAPIKPLLSEQLMIAQRLIEATAKHGEVPDDKLTALMVDIDLSSLALPWDQFNANTNDVVKEYALFRDEATITVGNARFLKGLYENSERLYHTDWGFENFESSARANILKRVNDLLPTNERIQ